MDVLIKKVSYKTKRVYILKKAGTHEGFFSRVMLQGHAPGAKLLAECASTISWVYLLLVGRF